MKRTISFGKIAYYGYRKVNEVEVEIELRLNEENKPVLSICGNIWNRIHSNILADRQCLDTIAKYKKTPLFKEIYVFWQKYHLNDAHPGTEIPENDLNRIKEIINKK
jgi:hypothetical protein